MRYGVVAEKLGHSFSPEIHAMIGDYDYELCELSRADFTRFMEKRDFLGINVTIPYKQDVIPYLDSIDDLASSIGAVNTIVNENGKLRGYNTDFGGMEMLIRHMGLSLSGKKVLILGSGGTSKTAKAVSEDLGASEIITVRRDNKNGAVTYEQAYEQHGDAQIIINTTPRGMFPNDSEMPADSSGREIDLSRFTRLEGLVDVIFNPIRTRLVLAAKERGIKAEGGLYMLVAQAVLAAEYFTGKKYGTELIDRIYAEMLKRKENRSPIAEEIRREIIRIEPSKAEGTIKAPPSKSDSHRLLICSALAKGESVIKGLSFSEDILATIDCLKALGSGIEISGNEAIVTGFDIKNTGETVLNCRESGSTLRFLIPIALLTGKKIVFTGSEKLFSRPLGIYEEICRDQDIVFEKTSRSLTVCGRLSPGKYRVRGDISSQFISGLLLALPLLGGKSEIDISEPFESAPYVSMTVKTLKKAGISVGHKRGLVYTVRGNQRYMPFDETVEGDFSNAAFFDALNLLGGNVKITGLSDDSLQGDKIYRQYFKMIKEGFPVLDLSGCPDLGPVCMAMAAAKNGASFTGIRRLRIKESDRIASMADELSKFGVKTEIEENKMTVFGGILHAPEETICGHNDHRIVMSLALLCTVTGGKINGYKAVSKSMPDFFERLADLGIKYETEELNNGMDK
ncbi:MAG: hypothetical protein II748_03055 [Clostridia bacterium]|nr:hypothetical protein [Clostridia bacterium]